MSSSQTASCIGPYCIRFCSNYFYDIVSFNAQGKKCEIGIVIVLVFQMRKLRHGVVKYFLNSAGRDKEIWSP